MIPFKKIERKYVVAVVVIVAAAIVSALVLANFSQFSILRSIDEDVPSPLRIVAVTSLEALAGSIDSALPGDQIVVKNGMYATTDNIVVAAKGTAPHPIVVTAESVSGVKISGSHGFYLNGAQHVIIHGFELAHSQDNSAETDDMAMKCNDCDHVRFTRNTFALTTAYVGETDDRSIDRYHSDWLGISGSGANNRIDHNIFHNKSTRGTFLLVLGEAGRLVTDTVIDHNLFSNQTYPLGNGGECVRIGNSALGPSRANMVMEYNTFERCNGDWEAVTIKSSNNMIRHNTFENNQGSLTFRHGNANIADGNVFIGGNNGIRAYGHDHKIINNYFANNTVQVSSLLGPIVIGVGTVLDDSSTSNAEYSQPRNILIVHNTITSCNAGILIGYGEGSRLPENITVANNIVTGTSGQLVEVLKGDVTFKNNIFFPAGSAAIGNAPSNGYRNVDPQLISLGKITSPSELSPAVDAIPSSEAYGVTTDVGGQTRSGRFDIGADELV